MIDATPAKPIVELTADAPEGNVLFMAAKVGSALRAAGKHRLSKEMSERLFRCKSYSETLELFKEYVTVLN